MKPHNEFIVEYNKLNTNQKQAVDTINGPVCILANAGSGKTTIVSLRCCYILHKTDMKPSNILCLTFSNAGVASMKKKLNELMGDAGEEIKVTTFHSFAVDIINSNSIGDSNKTRSLLSPGQRFMILEKLLANPATAGAYYDIKPLTNKKLHSLHDIFNVIKKECISNENIISYANHCLESILPFEEEYALKKGGLNAKGKKLAKQIEDFSKSIGPLYDAYQSILEEKGKYEYADMLNEAVYALSTNESLRQRIQENYQYIMVDEYQDCNKIMVALIQLLIKDVESPNLSVTGDELQTIYKFMGANLKNFEWISNMLPGLKTIVLDTNYRSTEKILNKSFDLIKQSAHIHPLKKHAMIAGSTNLQKWESHEPVITSYENQDQEAYFIAAAINELIKTKDDNEDIVVLSRKNNDLIPIKKWLKYFKVPFSTRASKGNVLETKYGKSIYYALTSLRFLDKEPNLADAYFCNLLLTCGYKKELGYAYLLYKKEKTTVSFISWLVLSTNNNRLLELIEFAIDILKFEGLKYKIITPEITEQFSGYIQKITKEIPLAIIRDEWDSFLLQFIASDKSKSLESLADLLEYHNHYQLSIEYTEENPTTANVLLSTIHGTKGLEYDYVFVVALEDKNYENKGEVNGSINVPKILNRFINTEAEDNEDLRRLIYVAMTRAKKNLNMSYSRIGFTGNAQSITCLLQPQIDSNSLSLIEIADSTLPDYTGTKEVIELDQEYLELVNEKLKEFNISTSSTNNWNDCQNKFFYHNICKIPGLPSAPTSFGSLLHSVLQSICTSNCLNPTQAQISNIVDDIFINYQNQFHALHRSIYKRYAKFVIQNYLEAFPIVKRPLHIEKYLTCTLPSGVRLHGYIDRVDMNDNNIHVIDYKSSKYSEKLLPFENDNNMGSGYWRQGMIYKQLIENNFTDKNNIALSFHYLVLNKIIDFNTEANLGFDNWLTKIWNEIQSLSFNESCNDEKCIYCNKD